MNNFSKVQQDKKNNLIYAKIVKVLQCVCVCVCVCVYQI